MKRHWPQRGIWSRVCVLCKPLKSFLGKIPYRQEFGNDELVYRLSKEVLPLKNGYTRNGKILDWMTCTITLKKIK